MTVTTIYKCDRCESEHNSHEQFWKVGVTASVYPYNKSGYSRPAMEVCRNCLEHMGIYPSESTKLSTTYHPPTVEDLIVELVQRTIEEGQ